MLAILSFDRLRFYINRFRQRLWVKPLVICLLSVLGAFVAKVTDSTKLGWFAPEITSESIENLLSIMATSMLVIATFAVASMVSAYASASSGATPRSFSLVVSDDMSQNALSTFIGAFIFSIVALTEMKNNYFDTAGRFTLFVLTVLVFGLVIFTFVRWVDRIARLGRLGTTIDTVEKATAEAMRRRQKSPRLGGTPPQSPEPQGVAIYGASVGYVQHVHIAALQSCAEAAGGRVRVTALPGTFATPGRALAYLRSDSGEELDLQQIEDAFLIDSERAFDDDPRFGLVVLSEIAGRALSPAINDPGTAIDILGSFVRLFVQWSGWRAPHEEAEEESRAAPEDAGDDAESGPHHDRVEVPEVSLSDMFDDAFSIIARDGAGAVEVGVRLQKALRSLTLVGDAGMREVALRHSRLALARAEKALELAEDLAAVRAAAPADSC